LVDCRIDAKRRKILALSSEGWPQSEIARLLSLDRQGVFKVIHSTEIKEFHSIVERLAEEAAKQEPKRKKQPDEILLSIRIRRVLSDADTRYRSTRIAPQRGEPKRVNVVASPRRYSKSSLRREGEAEAR